MVARTDLEQAAGCRRPGCAGNKGSPATLCKLKAGHGGLGLYHARRPKQLEGETAKLKRLVADTVRGAMVLKDLPGKS